METALIDSSVCELRVYANSSGVRAAELIRLVSRSSSDLKKSLRIDYRGDPFSQVIPNGFTTKDKRQGSMILLVSCLSYSCSVLLARSGRGTFLFPARSGGVTDFKTGSSINMYVYCGISIHHVT